VPAGRLDRDRAGRRPAGKLRGAARPGLGAALLSPERPLVSEILPDRAEAPQIVVDARRLPTEHQPDGAPGQRRGMLGEPPLRRRDEVAADHGVVERAQRLLDVDEPVDVSSCRLSRIKIPKELSGISEFLAEKPQLMELRLAELGMLAAELVQALVT